MKKIFIDTNIALDLLLERNKFFNLAKTVFIVANRQRITLCFSALSFGTITYFLEQKFTKEETKNKLKEFAKIVRILPFNEHIIDNALYSNFKDIEDGYQYFVAKEYNIPIIITRNTKDFLVDDLSVITPEQFLNMYRK
jgi:pilT domain-containing protein